MLLDRYSSLTDFSDTFKADGPLTCSGKFSRRLRLWRDLQFAYKELRAYEKRRRKNNFACDAKLAAAAGGKNRHG